MKPFLKWAGGKRRLLPELCSRLPEDIESMRHVEPFLGGGALFFARAPERALLSDVNPDLIATYEAIRDRVDEVIEALSELAADCSEAAYYRVRDRYNAGGHVAPADRAAMFIYLNRTGFNGLHRVNRKGEFNVPAGRYKAPRILDADGLRAASAALASAELRCADFEEVLAEAGPGDFVYLDPPYAPLSATSNFTSYAKDGFVHEDQTRLSAVVTNLNCRGCRVMISNSDAPSVRELYDGLAIETIRAPRSVSASAKSRGSVDEAVIRNYGASPAEADGYEDFLASKVVVAEPSGFDAGELAPHLFPFQSEIVRWALRRGRAAIFADTGLGKTAMQIEWSRQVAARAGRVLVFAPLAVAQQTVREAARFGVEIRYALDQGDAGDAPIVITNYERLARFDVASFAGVVLDESSILKSFMGKTKRALIESCAAVPFRLACTATPAPNDHLELGNHAEFLGVMQSHEMIARWFINDTSSFGTYRLKGHAVAPFWDWVASWAVCCARPSDLGYSDDGYVLPALNLTPHILDVDLLEDRGNTLFRMPDMNATSIHREKRRTVVERAAKLAELAAAEPNEQWIVWCDTDYEADALRSAIPEAVEVRGSHKSERKEQAAVDFVEGKIRVLISKPSIFGWGLNWQHVARVAFVGATFSYEAFYQAVRRSWRFGQKRPVEVHVTMASTEMPIWSTLTAKRDGHDEMRAQMSAAMRRAQARESRRNMYRPLVPMRLPAWLRSEAA